MKTDIYAKLSVWSPEGANITNKRVGKKVCDLLGEALPPGMAVEGYFSSKYESFQVMDLTFNSVENNKVRKVQPVGSQVQEMMDTPSQGETVMLRKTEENEMDCQRHQDSGDLHEIRIADAVTSYGANIPVFVSAREVAALPPDDYVLEEIPVGQRVIVLSPNDDAGTVLDMRGVAYDVRRKAVEKLCEKLNNPRITGVVQTTGRFGEFVSQRRDLTGTAGVLAKFRTGNYVSSIGAVVNPEWVCFVVKKRR